MARSAEQLWVLEGIKWYQFGCENPWLCVLEQYGTYY